MGNDHNKQEETWYRIRMLSKSTPYDKKCIYFTTINHKSNPEQRLSSGWLKS